MSVVFIWLYTPQMVPLIDKINYNSQLPNKPLIKSDVVRVCSLGVCFGRHRPKQPLHEQLPHNLYTVAIIYSILNI